MDDGDGVLSDITDIIDFEVDNNFFITYYALTCLSHECLKILKYVIIIIIIIVHIYTYR